VSVPPMHLERFADDNPNIEIGRPDWATPVVIAAFALVGAGCAGLGAWYAIGSDAAGAAVLWSVLGLGLSYPAVRGAIASARVWATMRRGRNLWALSDDQLLLVDAEGAAIVVALDRIVDVQLKDGEVHLRTDSDMQGVLYAILFRLFDDEGPCPSPDGFYRAITERLGAHAGAVVATGRSMPPPGGALAA
jgi:hypothetical protein